MRVLVWQWSRFGGAPRFAASLADGLRALPDTEALLSLSTRAELLRSASAPRCDLPVTTYGGLAGFALRAATGAFAVRPLAGRIRALAPDVAVCALPGPLDLLMAAALQHRGVPFVVLVHDADLHPGDGLPLQIALQRALCRRAAALGALSAHVGDQLIAQGLAGHPRPLLHLNHPPVYFAAPPPRIRPLSSLRLLSFGRLLPYKGLDLLADALALLGPQPGLELRIVGRGPESDVLNRLRAMPGVTVENRWVPEDEIGALLGWSDALVLSYREASQSGVAAAALAAGRRVLATRVGGLAEQLACNDLALLCEPDAANLAAGLRRLLAEPVEIAGAQPADAVSAWRDTAATLRDGLTRLLQNKSPRGA
jgi:glycosyltransferase involved in cell wall biosynthesis